MPTTRTIEVYQFSELSDDAKQRAIESNRDCNVHDEWHEYDLEFWKLLLSSIGIDDAEIGFSGFWSQGDGACIRDASFDSEKLSTFMANVPSPSESCGGETETELQFYLVHKLGLSPGFDARWDWVSYFNVLDEFSFNLTCVNSHYSHENCHRLSVDGYTGRDNVDAVVADLETELNELRRSICQTIYSSLESTHDAITSDDSVAEWLANNEIEFDADGNTI